MFNNGTHAYNHPPRGTCKQNVMPPWININWATEKALRTARNPLTLSVKACNPTLRIFAGGTKKRACCRDRSPSIVFRHLTMKQRPSFPPVMQCSPFVRHVTNADIYTAQPNTAHNLMICTCIYLNDYARRHALFLLTMMPLGVGVRHRSIPFSLMIYQILSPRNQYVAPSESRMSTQHEAMPNASVRVHLGISQGTHETRHYV